MTTSGTISKASGFSRKNPLLPFRLLREDAARLGFMAELLVLIVFLLRIDFAAVLAIKFHTFLFLS
jgi:hypothetical protein